jgi:hypothetical protein
MGTGASNISGPIVPKSVDSRKQIAVASVAATAERENRVRIDMSGS